MAAAAAFLPFLPLLPMQVLLNNFLYDLSEVPIPNDRVDDADLERPHRWDLAAVRRFMVVLGTISSVFDAATFTLLLALCHATPEQFRTGWFIESLATQVLVIFVIRTRLNPLRSRPSRVLAATSLAVIAAAVVLPYSPIGGWFGFVPLPPAFLLALAIIAACYLLLAECAKRWFYRRHPPRGTMRSPVARPSAIAWWYSGVIASRVPGAMPANRRVSYRPMLPNVSRCAPSACSTPSSARAKSPRGW